MGGKLLLAVIFATGVFLILAYVLLGGGILPAPFELAAIPFREAVWMQRSLDVLGQLALLLTGTYGVLVLVKERH